MQLQSVIQDSICVMITFENVKKFHSDHHRVYISLSNISVSHSVITVVQKFYRGKASREKPLPCPAFLYWRNTMRIHFTIIQLFSSKFWLKRKKQTESIWQQNYWKEKYWDFLGEAGQISANHKNFRSLLNYLNWCLWKFTKTF